MNMEKYCHVLIDIHCYVITVITYRGAMSLFQLRWRQGKMKPLYETITRLPYLKPRCYNSYITLCTVKSYSIHTLPMIPQTAVTAIRHQEFQYLDHFRTAYRANYMFGRIHL